jgi:hypothetical protein
MVSHCAEMRCRAKRVEGLKSRTAFANSYGASRALKRNGAPGISGISGEKITAEVVEAVWIHDNHDICNKEVEALQDYQWSAAFARFGAPRWSVAGRLLEVLCIVLRVTTRVRRDKCCVDGTA